MAAPRSAAGAVRAAPRVYSTTSRVYGAGPRYGYGAPRVYAAQRGGAVVVGHAVPRGYGSHVVVAHGYAPYRFYAPYYAFHPRFSVGFGLWVGFPVAYPYFYGGYPYYGYGYGYPYGYPYGYAAPYPYGYPPAYPPYPPSNYSSAPYPPSGSMNVQPGRAQGNAGGVSFDITPGDAEVVVDGQSMGTVGNFTPSTAPLTLEPGRHHIEIRAQGYRNMAFDVDIVPGQVVPYQGTLQR